MSDLLLDALSYLGVRFLLILVLSVLLFAANAYLTVGYLIVWYREFDMGEAEFLTHMTHVAFVVSLCFYGLWRVWPIELLEFCLMICYTLAGGFSLFINVGMALEFYRLEQQWNQSWRYDNWPNTPKFGERPQQDCRY